MRYYWDYWDDWDYRDCWDLGLSGLESEAPIIGASRFRIWKANPSLFVV